MSKKQILIVTSSFDKTVDYIIKKFPNEQFIRLNVDKLDQYKISVSKLEKFQIDIENKVVNIENIFSKIHSIYYRKLFLPKLDEYDSKYHTYMQKEIYTFITGLVDSFQGKVLTTPSILRKVENKIYQLSIADNLGFLLPKSLISNDISSVNNLNFKKLIAKPLSTGKLTSKMVCNTNIVVNKIENISLSPTYFQEYIPKDYELRVTVINSKFYCVKIIANNQIDWRKDYEKNIYTVIETPSIVKSQCELFMQTCDLQFGAFDYIVRNNQFYFLECNPNGQWLWLELELKLDISTSLVRFLSD